MKETGLVYAFSSNHYNNSTSELVRLFSASSAYCDYTKHCTDRKFIISYYEFNEIYLHLQGFTDKEIWNYIIINCINMLSGETIKEFYNGRAQNILFYNPICLNIDIVDSTDAEALIVTIKY